jgi:Ca2+-binding EF-hand superfamily protein/CRP-like cAMP-binding protein
VSGRPGSRAEPWPRGSSGGPGQSEGSQIGAAGHDELADSGFGVPGEDGDGVVSKEELQRGLRRMLKTMEHGSGRDRGHMTQTELTDTSKNGALKKALASMNVDQEQLKEIIRFAFDRFDLDGDGRIDLKEFTCAAKLLGMRMTVDEVKLVFQSVCGTENYIVAEDVTSVGWNSWGDAVSKAMMKQYAKKGLNKFEYFVENAKEILNQDMQLQKKVQKLWALLASQHESLVDFTQVIVDILGFSIAVVGIFNELDDSIDIANILPFVFFLFISARDIGRQLKVHVQADMDGSTALAYAQVFKPAGITIDDFFILNERGAFQWRTVQAGETITYTSRDDRNQQLGLVVNGEVEVMQRGLLGFAEDLAVLGPGSFVGAVDFLTAMQNVEGEGQGPAAASEGEYFIANRDTLLLTWDATKLQRFLACEEGLGQKMRGLVANSIVSNVAQMKKSMVQRTAQDRELFERFTRLLHSKIPAERATIWIYSEQEDELWTLLMNNTSTEFFVSVGARNSGLAAHAFETGDDLIVPDCYADPRFNKDVDRNTGFVTSNMLCAPISRRSGERPIAVLQFMNRLDGGGRASAFSDDDRRSAQDLMWPLIPAIETIFRRNKHRHPSDRHLHQQMTSTCTSR